jgi:thiol-disulfide isomerase/thioredoxin
VDFWATWCGPCVAEMPNVKKAYDRYHAKGFEVVGVSLDSEQAPLDEFVKENKIPWVQVFHKPVASDDNWQNPLAKKYNVTGIPAMFLIGKDGKVVSRNVRGEALEKALARLLGPAEDKTTEAKPAAKTGG